MQKSPAANQTGGPGFHSTDRGAPIVGGPACLQYGMRNPAKHKDERRGFGDFVIDGNAHFVKLLLLLKAGNLNMEL
jgi:hypothetical protein